MEYQDILNDKSLSDQFRAVGLDPAKLNDLPPVVVDNLLKGEQTPLIALPLKSGAYDFGTVPMKLQIQERGDHKVLMATPVCRDIHDDFNLDADTRNKLIKGDAVMMTKSREDTYFQLDNETNVILRMDKKDFERSLQDVEKINDIELGKEQKTAIREGKPVEVEIGGEKAVLGVDLRSPKNFRVLLGDMNEWENQKKIEYDILHPEYIGVVKTDENPWEYMKVQLDGVMSRDLKERPAISKNSSMKLS